MQSNEVSTETLTLWAKCYVSTVKKAANVRFNIQTSSGNMQFQVSSFVAEKYMCNEFLANGLLWNCGLFNVINIIIIHFVIATKYKWLLVSYCSITVFIKFQSICMLFNTFTLEDKLWRDKTGIGH